MKKIAIFIMSWLVIATCHAGDSMSIPETVESYYILSVMDSYQAVIESIESNAKPIKNHTGRTILIDTMYKFVGWRYGVRKAISTLLKYDDSNEKNIVLINTIVKGSLLNLDIHLTNSINETEKFLNMPEAEQARYIATYAKNTKEELAALNDAFSLYGNMGAQVPSVLTESLQMGIQMMEGKTTEDLKKMSKQDIDKTSNKLLISRREINNLKNQLQIRFPKIVAAAKGGNKDTLPEYAWPVYFLYKFLSDKWVAVDE